MQEKIIAIAPNARLQHRKFKIEKVRQSSGRGSFGLTTKENIYF